MQGRGLDPGIGAPERAPLSAPDPSRPVRCSFYRDIYSARPGITYGDEVKSNGVFAIVAATQVISPRHLPAMTNSDLPAIILVATVWCYWFGIGVKIVRARRRSHDLAGLVPEQARERAMWVIWIPLVVAWIVLPWLSLRRSSPWLAVPEFARDEPAYATLRWLAAVVALAMPCDDHVVLVDDGQELAHGREREAQGCADYRRALHLCPASHLRAVDVAHASARQSSSRQCRWRSSAVVHIVLNNIKARNEEQYLLRAHGEPYAQYVRRTGRFFPRVEAKAL